MPTQEYDNAREELRVSLGKDRELIPLPLRIAAEQLLALSSPTTPAEESEGLVALRSARVNIAVMRAFIQTLFTLLFELTNWRHKEIVGRSVDEGARAMAEDQSASIFSALAFVAAGPLTDESKQLHANAIARATEPLVRQVDASVGSTIPPEADIVGLLTTATLRIAADLARRSPHEWIDANFKALAEAGFTEFASHGKQARTTLINLFTTFVEQQLHHAGNGKSLECAVETTEMIGSFARASGPVLNAARTLATGRNLPELARLADAVRDALQEMVTIAVKEARRIETSKSKE